MTTFFSRILSFSQKLFFLVISLFIAFSLCFMCFQYRREKVFKSELLNTQLQDYNSRLYDFINENGNLNADSLQQYVATHMIPNLRVTLITSTGIVIYDNTEKNWKKFKNHSSRKEVIDALMYGSGYAISRHSES